MIAWKTSAMMATLALLMGCAPMKEQASIEEKEAYATSFPVEEPSGDEAKALLDMYLKCGKKSEQERLSGPEMAVCIGVARKLERDHFSSFNAMVGWWQRHREDPVEGDLDHMIEPDGSGPEIAPEPPVKPNV